MTLYTELEIKENATREEIRAAYLRLAKEAHPDKSKSESERVIAEGVMLRLNQIMVVLGDDEKRKEYDAALRQQREEAEAAVQRALALQVRTRHSRPAWMGWSSQLWFAGLMLLVAGAAGVVWFSDFKETQWWQEANRQRPVRPAENPGRENPAPRKSAPAVQVKTPPTPEQRLRPVAANSLPAGNDGKRTESALVEEARRALETAREDSKAKTSEPAPANTRAAMEAPQAKVEVSAPPPPTVPATAETTRREALTRWGGVWRYLPGKGGGPGGPFPPLAIEMRLQESGAGVRGVYKASYEGTGKKYSPDVVFSLAGQTEGNQVRGEWTGQEGARGGFELKRIESRIVQVSWWTTALGRKPSLASGVARLVESAQ